MRWACAQLGLATWLCALGAVELALTHPAVYKVRPDYALLFFLPCPARSTERPCGGWRAAMGFA